MLFRQYTDDLGPYVGGEHTLFYILSFNNIASTYLFHSKDLNLAEDNQSPASLLIEIGTLM